MQFKDYEISGAHESMRALRRWCTAHVEDQHSSQERATIRAYWLRESAYIGLRAALLGDYPLAFRCLLQVHHYAGSVGHDVTTSDAASRLQNLIESHYLGSHEQCRVMVPAILENGPYPEEPSHAA